MLQPDFCEGYTTCKVQPHIEEVYIHIYKFRFSSPGCSPVPSLRYPRRLWTLFNLAQHVSSIYFCLFGVFLLRPPFPPSEPLVSKCASFLGASSFLVPSGICLALAKQCTQQNTNTNGASSMDAGCTPLSHCLGNPLAARNTYLPTWARNNQGQLQNESIGSHGISLRGPALGNQSF